MGYWPVVCVVLSLLVFGVVGDTGPCRYENNYCSCKLGQIGQGTCWDQITAKPGWCKRRTCMRGWTCSCAGRTHVCIRAPQSVNTVADLDRTMPEAPCIPTIQHQVVKPTLRLGYFKPSLSRAGMGDDMCAQFTWWHNGLFRGDWGFIGGVQNTTTVNRALTERADHSLLELKPGDLIAFQFSQASYYCYNHFSALQVNGLNITTNMRGVVSHYARQFSTNWFDPSYKLNETNTAMNETEPDLTKFLPPRTHMLDDNSTILPNVDYWQPDRGASEDHRTADWFWRIQIPHDLLDPTATSF